MRGSPWPIIECEITFLTETEGGRQSPPLLNGYRPHFVVGDPNQREAIRGRHHLTEDYLGVLFLLETLSEERCKPQLGMAAGQVQMSEDFDAPLPEFEKYR